MRPTKAQRHGRVNPGRSPHFGAVGQVDGLPVVGRSDSARGRRPRQLADPEVRPTSATEMRTAAIRADADVEYIPRAAAHSGPGTKRPPDGANRPPTGANRKGSALTRTFPEKVWWENWITRWNNRWPESRRGAPSYQDVHDWELKTRRLMPERLRTPPIRGRNPGTPPRRPP